MPGRQFSLNAGPLPLLVDAALGTLNGVVARRRAHWRTAAWISSNLPRYHSGPQQPEVALERVFFLHGFALQNNWGGPSARPQISSGFWTQFWGPPAQCVSPGFSAKSQNRSAASPAPPRRSAPIELQTKAVWPNVRGVIFVARDTGIQGPYSATPPVRH